MLERLNKHLNLELYASYSYFSMAAYCHSINMTGAANWMLKQAEEEVAHAMKFYNFINDRGGRVELLAIKQPAVEFSSMLDVFEKALAHEQKITQAINELVTSALDKKDNATHSFLQWFVTEQVEEEATITEVVEALRLVGDNGHGLLMIDRELKLRKNEAA